MHTALWSCSTECSAASVSAMFTRPMPLCTGTSDQAALEIKTPVTIGGFEV